MANKIFSLLKYADFVLPSNLFYGANETYSKLTTYAIFTRLGWCRTPMTLLIPSVENQCTSTLQGKCAGCDHS